MVRKIQVELILLLRITDMSHSSVSEVFRIANERNITYADVESKSYAEVYSMFYPDKYLYETMYMTNHCSTHTKDLPEQFRDPE